MFSADDQNPWWREAVMYQIYPRSFADSGGDGVGDLDGIRRHVEYLSDLGVDGIWISPFYPSPMADGGYDISDYTDVDPLFGDLASFDALLAEAHQHGLRVIVDFVPNHSSDQHPWFVNSRSSRTNPQRDWYVWRDEPNNWRAALGAGSAWTWDQHSGQYYLHLFLPQQPDLNWRNSDVVDAMHSVLRFWLDRGVDGFRIDAVQCIGNDPAFADDPRCAAGEPLADFNDQPYTHEVLRGLRRLVDDYPGEQVLVGEVNIRSTQRVARYYGAGDELQLAFNFQLLDAPWDPVVFRMSIHEIETEMAEMAAWPTWVLSNHDNHRQRSRYGGSLRRARAVALIELTLRGTPFLYQGEELGLLDAEVPPERRVDPGGRDGARAPLPWQEDPPHGWVGAKPWLPFPPHAGELSVESQLRQPDSILQLYRRLIAERKSSRALRQGSWTELDSPPEVLAYERRIGGDVRVVAVNFSDEPRRLDLDGHWTLVLQTTGDERTDDFSGALAPEQGALLRPRST